MGITMDWKATRIDNEIAQMCMSALNAGLEREELDILMAEVSLGMLAEYSPIPEPRRPGVLVKFDRDRKSSEWQTFSGAEKAALYSKIYKREEVLKYLEESFQVTSKLYGNVRRLEELIDIFLLWGERDKALRCHTIYSEYPDVLMVNAKDELWRKKKKWDSPRR